MFRSLFRSVRSFFVSLFGSSEASARLAVEYATFKLLEAIDLNPSTLELLSESFLDTRGSLLGRIRAVFGYSHLSGSERLLVDEFAHRVFEAATQLTGGDPPVASSVSLRRVYGWVRDAAARHAE